MARGSLMRISIILLLLLNAIISFGQSQDWQEVADNYLETAVIDYYIAWDLQEQFIAKLKEEFKQGSLTTEETHLLGILYDESITQEESEEYYKTVTSGYADKPFRKALFILSHCRNTYDQEAAVTLKRIQEAIELLQSVGQDSSLVSVHAHMRYGGVLMQISDFKQALKVFSKALAISETIGKSHPVYEEALGRLASYYTTVGNLEMAAQIRKQAELNVLQERGINIPYPVIFKRHTPGPALDMLSTPGWSAERYRLALLFLYANEYNPYNEVLAVTLFNELEDASNTEWQQSEFYGQFLIHKGLQELSLANEHQAVETLQKSIEFFKKPYTEGPDQFSGITNSLNAIGCAYYNIGEYQKALHSFQQCDSLFRSVKLLYGQDFIQHNILITLSKHNDMKGLRDVLRSFRSGTEITEDFTARMTRYGDLMMRVDDYAGAFKFYTKAYDEYWSEVQMEYYEGKENEEFLEDDMEIIDEEQIVLDIGPTETISVIHPYKPNGLHYRTLLFKLAKASFLVEEYALARKYVLSYINEFYTEIERERNIMERGSDLYEIYRLKNELFPAYDLFQNILFKDSLVRIENNGENIMLAFLQILDSKANIQYEYRHMRTTIENSEDPELRNLYRQYLEVRDRLVKVKLDGYGTQEDVEQLSIAIDTLKAQLSSRTALFAPMEKTFTSWLEVGQTLKKNEAAIEIRRVPRYKSGQWTDENIYAAYIITHGSKKPEVVFLPEGNLLEGRYLKNYQNSIQYKLEDTISYGRFWKPIQEKLGKISKIFLSPDGVYNQINLNTLFNPETKRYLIDDLKILHVISTKELSTTKPASGQIQSVTLMGRPAYFIETDKENPFDPIEDSPDRAITREQLARGTIDDLPGTEKEIVAIRKIMDDKKIPTAYFIGNHSSEENFKRSAGSIMHIATHGFWLQGSADEKVDAMFHSGLLFAGIKNYVTDKTQMSEEDGILTAYEVEGMDLNETQLVVLSACETALGHIDVGEGVYGLQRAFKIAGVDKMIMSLWKVNDDATQELFVSFYSNWISKNMPIETAFYQAQAELKRKYTHPYYWGGFVFIE